MKLNPASTGGAFLNALFSALQATVADSNTVHPVDIMGVVTGACETIYQLIEKLPSGIWYVSE